LGSDYFTHPAEAIAYAVLLFTLAILPLALALSGPSKDPLFVASASSITFFLLVGVVAFLIGTGRAVLRRDD